MAVATAMSAAKYDLASRLLLLLTGEHAEEGNYDEGRGWTLAEAQLRDDGTVVPTHSHAFDFLHESLLTADPTGREGQDLFA